MIQGTASHAGKSTLVAALCRIFRRQGLRVAPFKAQNMALNAYVTSDGGEMARSQATQAEAAGIVPTVEMNPVLLKATSHTSAQVIVMGRVVGDMGVLEYRSFKTTAWQVIRDAFRSLSEKYDLILIEGAGSPAEINLKSHDIVNMRVAELADAPVLLVGDIDRGGLFASFVGTFELLSPEERNRLAGFVINRFRGDPTLLKGGIDFLSQRLGRDVLGVIPYLEDLDLPEEDGVSLQNQAGRALEGASAEEVRIAVVRLPHISNFTDFDPFDSESGVRLEYLQRPGELSCRPDLLILPGTKQTLSDLSSLFEAGWKEAIWRYLRQGGRVAGICGGYQILGERVSDPQGVEGRCGSIPGLGLLGTETVLESEKRVTQVEGRTSVSAGSVFRVLPDTPIRGYEIHVGRTYGRDGRSPLFYLSQSAGLPEVPEGRVDGTGSVWGTYLHGLFENDLLRRGLVQELRDARGAPPPQGGGGSAAGSFSLFRERAFERLADAVEGALNMKAICDLL